MRWILGIAFLFGLGVAGVWVLGRLLPVAHEVTVSKTIAAPVDEVWARIDDPEAWEQWRTDLEKVEIDSPETIVVTDGNGTIRYRLERPDERTLLTVIDQEDLPFGGRWIWLVEPDGEATRVTITEQGEIHSPLFRFFARYVFGYDATIRSVLDQLDASLSGARPIGGDGASPLRATPRAVGSNAEIASRGGAVQSPVPASSSPKRETYVS